MFQRPCFWSRLRTFQIAQATWIDKPLVAVLAVTVIARGGGVFRPLLGNFATKNIVYAMIARNWATGVSSIWYPTLDAVHGDYRALHMLEFPISAYLTGAVWRIGGGSLDVWGRLTAIAFSLGSVALLYGLVVSWYSRRAAVAATMVFALSPVGILCGQSFMLEASLVFFMLATLSSFDRWLATRRPAWIAVSAVALACALLTKIYLVVLLLPLLASYQQIETCTTLDRRRKRVALIAFALALAPAGLWYWHAAATAAPSNPLVNRVFYSIRDSVTVHAFPRPELGTPALYARVAADLGTVVLTPIGLMLVVAGLWHRGWRRQFAWLLASLLLILFMPLKFFHLNYYYLAVLPPLCILAGLGWEVLATRWGDRRRVMACIALIGVGCSARYAFRPAFVTPLEDRPVLPAAMAVRSAAARDEPVATMHGSTLDLLYYCGQRGWFLAPDDDDLEQKLITAAKRGARLLAVVNPDQVRAYPRNWQVLEHLPVAVAGNGYTVFRIDELVSPTSPTGAGIVVSSIKQR